MKELNLPTSHPANLIEANIISEALTLDQLLKGHSIARFGDGELRLAAGQSVGHQQALPNLVEELRHILRNDTRCLVGVPYIGHASPKADTWRHYMLKDKIIDLFNPEKKYYSAFITRPDSAPWINTPIYWNSVAELWKGKDVTLVCGSNKGFRVGEMEREVKSLRFIKTLPEQAYQDINDIEKEVIKTPNNITLLAVGATATVLAHRLAEKNMQALDLGHLPMFMRRNGVFDAGK